MNYRHLYHAGNFADVFKHAVLLLILEKLNQKSAPWVYVDTHAGLGWYAQEHLAQQKTREFEQGVLKVWETTCPELETYRQALRSLGALVDDKLCAYPGSPAFAKSQMRVDDKLILNECHPEIFPDLKRQFAQRGVVAVHQRDAYEFLPAILPPSPNRGLVLIDPPFEQADEYSQILELVQKSLKRWPTGIYLIWTPITIRTPAFFDRKLQAMPGVEVLTATLSKTSSNDTGLVGCRLYVMNPPFGVSEQLKILTQGLQRLF